MGYYNHVDTFATAKSHVLKEMMKRMENNMDFKDYGSGDYVLQKNKLGASYYDLPSVFDGKGRCRSRNFPHDCVYTECIFCPHFIPEGIKIIQGKLEHNKKRFPIPGAFLQHVFGDLIPLICCEAVKII